MSFKIISLVALSALVGTIYAQNGQPCHASFFNFTPRHALNMTEYMGDWYMHEIGSSHIGGFEQPDWKCARRSLSLPNITDVDHIVAQDSFVNATDGTFIQESKEIVVNATRSPLNSIWYMTAGEDELVNTNVIILSADLEFNQWTVVYSCSIRGPDAYRYEVTMAMTRSKVITPELRQFLKALMVGVGFHIDDQFPIDQTDC